MLGKHRDRVQELQPAKRGRTPTQAGMQLVRKPKQPNWLPAASLQVGITCTPERWQIYLKLEKRKPSYLPETETTTDVDPEL